MRGFEHTPVLLDACIDGLCIRPGGLYVDCTAGGGGHARAIADKLSEQGWLLCIDRDADALRETARVLGDYPSVMLAADEFSNIKTIFTARALGLADGFLADLGVSSYQLDEPARGFSYMHDAALDMRMDQTASLTAYDVVNGYAEDRLRRILSDYGEERWAARIAAFIVKERAAAPITTTHELTSVIKKAIPRGAREDGPHPAKRTFQAIRIEVNNELAVLEPAVRDMATLLKPGGRICIITFHSLEDRIIKNTFRDLANPCQCPTDLPVCVCGKKPQLTVISRKPVLPDQTEIDANPRARSAKLRIAEKIGETEVPSFA